MLLRQTARTVLNVMVAIALHLGVLAAVSSFFTDKVAILVVSAIGLIETSVIWYVLVGDSPTSERLAAMLATAAGAVVSAVQIMLVAAAIGSVFIAAFYGLTGRGIYEEVAVAVLISVGVPGVVCYWVFDEWKSIKQLEKNNGTDS